MSPIISIIIPLYNKKDSISLSIDSILSQDYSNYEIIVVDDGSTDGSLEYVKKYSDPRIKIFNKPNGGVSSARNHGIEKSTGEWLLFLDADDELMPGALKLFGENATVSYNVVLGQQIYNNSKISTDSRIRKSTFPFFDIWLNNFYPRPGAMLIRKSCVMEYGGFDERMSFFEDYEFGLRLMRAGKIVYTKAPVVRYNQGESGLSNSRHPIEKEMAYYIPQIIGKTGFIEKALLYDNIEFELNLWSENEKNYTYYKEMQRNLFHPLYKHIHWLHQQLNRHHII